MAIYSRSSIQNINNRRQWIRKNNLINNQRDIDEIYLHDKDPYEANYQYLTDKHEKVGLNHNDDPMILKHLLSI